MIAFVLIALRRGLGLVASLALIGSVGGTANADSDPATSGKYRLLEGSVAVIISDGAFDVYVRTNRALPRNGRRAAAANLRLSDLGGASGLKRVGRPGAHCYSQVVTDYGDGPRYLRRPKPGRRAPVFVLVDGSETEMRSRATLIREEKHPEDRLGC